MRRFADHPAAGWALAAVALALAALSARPFAGGWGDGSRLAAVESLLDRGTLAIDDSVYCHPPQRLTDQGTPPYPADRPDLLAFGTLDKLFIAGHFYSDKPAVGSVLMAGLYAPLMWAGVPGPGDRPDLFCWVMTVLTSGAGYAAAVGSLWALGRRAGLAPGLRLGWVLAFANATIALTYTRHVNNHAPHLGAVAGICLLLARAADAHRAGRTAWGSIAGAGFLAGFAYNLDLGGGPLLILAVAGAVGWRTRRGLPVVVCLAAAGPWVAAGLGLNYALGGVWQPVNMVPEYLRWPGSPFTPDNLTGFFRHGPADQAVYAAALWVGKHGFLNHNLPLLLAVAGGWAALRQPFPHRPELFTLLLWCLGTWGLYAVLSNNFGGACCSVRWFLPFLAPGFWVLAVVLRDRPELRADLAALAVWGGVLANVMWWKGPFLLRMVPLMWPIVAAGLLTWVAVARPRRPVVEPGALGRGWLARVLPGAIGRVR